MAFSLFGSKHTRDILIFYIDSSSVAAVVTRFTSGEMPHILWSKRAEIPLKQELDFASFQSSTISALDKVISDCAKNIPVRPKEFYGVLSSPWFVSQTRVAHIKSDNPFVANKEFIEKVVADEVVSFEHEHVRAHDVILQKENSIIEVRTMQIELNGYPTNTVGHHKISDFKASVFISMSSKDILQSFRSVLARNFHAHEVKFHTLPFVAFSTLRDIVPGPEQFIFIDINGEITDLSIVNHGIIMETISFPLGYNFLLRKVAQTFASSLSEAKTLLETHAKKELHGALIGKLENDISYAKDEWLKSLAKVLEQSSFDYLLPDVAYVVGHRSTSSYFTEFLGSDFLKQYTITNKPIHTQIVTSDLLKNFCTVDPDTESDVFIYLATLFQHKLFNL